MDEYTLMQTVQSYLASNLSVDVVTEDGTEDSRPVPAVILDEVDFTDISYHNTHLDFVEERDGAGLADIRYFKFRYWARLDFLIRETSDTAAMQLFQNLKNLFRPLSENPSLLHSDVRELNLRGGGGFSHNSAEDEEVEMTYAVRLRSSHEMTNVDNAGFDSSTLDTIQNTLNPGQNFNVTN